MSRQRFIHPNIWRCPELARLPADAQLLFIGCFSTADDYGRRRAEAELLKADIFPLRDDLSAPNVGQIRDKLAQVGLIRIYGDGKYLDLPTWGKWQRPKYRKDSHIPEFRAKLAPKPGQTGDNLSPDPGQIGVVGSSCNSNCNCNRDGFSSEGYGTPEEAAKARAAHMRKHGKKEAKP